MLRYFFISEQSRKSKTIRQTYEHLKNRVDKAQWEASVEWESLQGEDGIPVPRGEKSRLLGLKIQDEHLSPYVKTDMNLFQMHMLDDTAEITVYRATHGWLVTYDGVADGPKPFGNVGYDTR